MAADEAGGNAGQEISVDLDEHLDAVVRALKRGNLVPVLGAGANLCGRPKDVGFERGRYLPNGQELAQELAKSFDYPAHEPLELVRVSQYAYLLDGSGPLYDALHEVFNQDYPPTPLHAFLAEVPARLRTAGLLRQHPLLVTTNYDDSLERALKSVGEEFDLVSYVAQGKHRGKFRHWPSDAEPRIIEEPERYLDVSPKRRTVILKIHGLVDRVSTRPEDSYVITEDHYIEYLSWTDLDTFLPVTLLEYLKYSHFLFLGYSMRDWNLRAILNRLWAERDGKTYTSWAIQVDPDRIDRRSWELRSVYIFDVPLDRYVEELRARFEQSLQAAS
jgi:hypothetical protein